MARSKQTIKGKGRTTTKSSKSASKSRTKKSGNQKRCPACGRFM